MFYFSKMYNKFDILTQKENVKGMSYPIGFTKNILYYPEDHPFDNKPL